MHRRTPGLLAVTLLGLAAIAATAASGPKRDHPVKLWLDQDGDKLVVDDLGDLAPGESRDYTTDTGKRVTVTHESDGYLVDLEGKEIRIREGGELPDPDGERTIFLGGGGSLLPLAGVDELVAGLERSPKFQALDDATQQLVRDVVREAAPVAWRSRHVELRRAPDGEKLEIHLLSSPEPKRHE